MPNEPRESALYQIHLDAGLFVLQMPAGALSQEDALDLEVWLALIVRQARRRAGMEILPIPKVD